MPVPVPMLCSFVHSPREESTAGGSILAHAIGPELVCPASRALSTSFPIRHSCPEVVALTWLRRFRPLEIPRQRRLSKELLVFSTQRTNILMFRFELHPYFVFWFSDFLDGYCCCTFIFLSVQGKPRHILRPSVAWVNPNWKQFSSREIKEHTRKVQMWQK